MLVEETWMQFFWHLFAHHIGQELLANNTSQILLSAYILAFQNSPCVIACSYRRLHTSRLRHAPTAKLSVYEFGDGPRWVPSLRLLLPCLIVDNLTSF